MQSVSTLMKYRDSHGPMNRRVLAVLVVYGCYESEHIIGQHMGLSMWWAAKESGVTDNLKAVVPSFVQAWPHANPTLG